MTKRRLDHPGWFDVDELLAEHLELPAGVLYGGIYGIGLTVNGPEFIVPETEPAGQEWHCVVPLNPDAVRQDAPSVCRILIQQLRWRMERDGVRPRVKEGA